MHSDRQHNVCIIVQNWNQYVQYMFPRILCCQPSRFNLKSSQSTRHDKLLRVPLSEQSPDFEMPTYITEFIHQNPRIPTWTFHSEIQGTESQNCVWLCLGIQSQGRFCDLFQNLTYSQKFGIGVLGFWGTRSWVLGLYLVFIESTATLITNCQHSCIGHWKPRWCWVAALRPLEPKELVCGINQAHIIMAWIDHLGSSWLRGAIQHHLACWCLRQWQCWALHMPLTQTKVNWHHQHCLLYGGTRRLSM